ncbi:MAG TPA: FlhC family transcriptional regulator [Azospirillaceae bacterium]|nr:FlhC family transcriptional regulator [Azospirillaceae bacterium]
MTPRLQNIASHRIVLRLIEHKLRTPLIVYHTDLSPAYLRELYKEMHGESPKAGRVPEAQNILSSRMRVIEASLLMNLYLRYADREGARRAIQIEPLVDAYDAYLQIRAGMADKNLLDINEAWVLARQYRSEELSASRCAPCAAVFFTVPDQKVETNCPACGVQAGAGGAADEPEGETSWTDVHGQVVLAF